MARTAAALAAPQRAPRPAPRRDAPRRPDLRVVPRPRRRIRALGALVVVLVFGAAFALVVFQTILVQNQQRLDQLEERIDEETDRYQRNRLQIAELESPDHIVAEATQRLGMVPPPGVTYLTPSGAVTVAGDGAADLADGNDSYAQVKPFLEGAG